MDGPQDDLIEQIMRVSLEKQAALRDKAPAGDGLPSAPDSEDGHPDAPDPAEAPPKAREQPPPKAEPPKAGKALVGLTAALAVAAAALLIVCLVQFQAYKDAVSGLRETMADIQSIDEFRTENQQLRQELDEIQKELDELQQELAETQSDLWIAQNHAKYQENSYNGQVFQSSGLWACLVAREIYATGDPEGAAATLKLLLNNRAHLTDMQSYIRGKNYSLWEMMTELVDKLRAEGYLSQEEADSINDKFSEVPIVIGDVVYG